mmetsp:Transcript_4443/g.6760  ORF Transcript_4443/g.6760 Transcript_4443/m.6760 type:complete len:340 (+) Transcript_4443:452-1471(+)
MVSLIMTKRAGYTIHGNPYWRRVANQKDDCPTKIKAFIQYCDNCCNEVRNKASPPSPAFNVNTNPTILMANIPYPTKSNMVLWVVHSVGNTIRPLVFIQNVTKINHFSNEFWWGEDDDTTTLVPSEYMAACKNVKRAMTPLVPVYLIHAYAPANMSTAGTVRSWTLDHLLLLGLVVVGGAVDSATTEVLPSPILVGSFTLDGKELGASNVLLLVVLAVAVVAVDASSSDDPPRRFVKRDDAVKESGGGGNVVVTVLRRFVADSGSLLLLVVVRLKDAATDPHWTEATTRNEVTMLAYFTMVFSFVSCRSINSQVLSIKDNFTINLLVVNEIMLYSTAVS